MSQPSFHPSGIELADQVQENFIAYFRLFADLPGISFVEADMTWIVSQGLPGNLVLRTKLSGDAIESRLDEALRRIGQASDQIDWFVFPGCQPDDLGDQLAKRGLAGGPDGAWTLVGQIGGPGGTWLWADLTSLPGSPPVSANFQVIWVRDHALLKTWQHINAEGFGGGDYQIFYDAFARHGFGPDAMALHYIGYLNDHPVTSATLLLAGGIASVYNVSTPPSLRRQGFGSAITYAALQAAQKRGYQAAYIWSSPLGQGVYRKLGFIPADFGIREYPWQKRKYSVN
jgi:ribosomal protein S18 acetylase RimI-like enzyme